MGITAAAGWVKRNSLNIEVIFVMVAAGGGYGGSDVLEAQISIKLCCNENFQA